MLLVWVACPVSAATDMRATWTTRDIDSHSASAGLPVPSSYSISNPRQVTLNYTYAIAASGRYLEVSIYIASSFAYSDVTDTIVSVMPRRPFEYRTTTDDLGNNVLTVSFQSEDALGRFYLTVLQHVTVYSVTYQIDPRQVGIYDTGSELYGVYTKPAKYIESDSPEIVAASKEIVGEETNPYLMAKRIYRFVLQHMTYDSSLDSPERPDTEGALFALRSGKGVCRHFAALATALARAAGIPTADIWGSRTDPVDGVYKHNWVHFYIPNYGWIPADPTLEKRTGNWFGRLPDSGNVPLMSGNYVHSIVWWSGGTLEEAGPGEPPVIYAGFQVSEYPTSLEILLATITAVASIILRKKNRRVRSS